jgi:hypothetical protein
VLRGGSGDLNRCICRSRRRVGRCEFSAQLLRYRLVGARHPSQYLQHRIGPEDIGVHSDYPLGCIRENAVYAALVWFAPTKECQIGAL